MPVSVELLNNALVRIMIGTALALLVFLFIFTDLGVVPFPGGISDAITWLFGIVWSADFILDIPVLLWWFQTIFHLAIIFISINIILFIVNIYSNIKK